MPAGAWEQARGRPTPSSRPLALFHTRSRLQLAGNGVRDGQSPLRVHCPIFKEPAAAATAGLARGSPAAPMAADASPSRPQAVFFPRSLNEPCAPSSSTSEEEQEIRGLLAPVLSLLNEWDVRMCFSWEQPLGHMACSRRCACISEGLLGQGQHQHVAFLVRTRTRGTQDFGPPINSTPNPATTACAKSRDGLPCVWTLAHCPVLKRERLGEVLFPVSSINLAGEAEAPCRHPALLAAQRPRRSPR